MIVFVFSRYFGLPTLTKKRISIGGGHESEATVPPMDQLNKSSEEKLIQFFLPFELLLHQLVEGKLNLDCASGAAIVH